MAKKIVEKVLLAQIVADKSGLFVLKIRASEAEKWKKARVYAHRRSATRGARRIAAAAGFTKVCLCSKSCKK